MDIIAAYQQVGTYRGAAAMCGTTHKTVRRIIERRRPAAGRRRGCRGAVTTTLVAELVAERVEATKGRISAKRLLPAAQAAGYAGSARNFRRLVAEAKKAWRRDNHRGRRPAVWTPGEVLAIDWGSAGRAARVLRGAGLVAVPVRAVRRQRAVRDDAGDAGGVLRGAGRGAGKVLADRMGCLKGGVVANKVVPDRRTTSASPTHYGFRPDWCEAADPESKGIVENLVGYAKRDLIVPQAPFGDLAAANVAARGVVRGGQRRGALGDLRGPGRAAGGRAGPAGRAAVAAGQHRQGW